LKEDISFDGLTNIMKENGLKIDGDELYNEYTMFQSAAEELIKSSCINRSEKGTILQKSQCSKFVENCTVCFVYSCSAIVECVFSIMKNLWTDDQNRLQIKTVESELAVRLNFKMMCVEFH
jgi:hypothetical protein